jgi:hypothetical protein
MEPEQIQSELLEAINGPNGWQSLQHLVLKLKKENFKKVLDALLGTFFFKGNNYFRVQVGAGGLLWKVKPKYERNLREDIKRSLQNWDVSVEELPWYFAEVTGIEKVREEIKSLLTETLDETSRKKAETYFYWLSERNPEEFRTQLNQRWNGRLRG